MNYYVKSGENIVLFDTDRTKLENTLAFIPNLTSDVILETEREIIYLNDGFVFADEVTEELLDDAKRQKIEENKTAYDAALKAGVMYKNALFDCDTLAAVRVMGQLTAMNAVPLAEGETVDWFDYDYQPVALTQSEFMDLAALITQNTRRIETLNCGFNTAIQAAASKEELEAIEISYAAETPSGDESLSPSNDEAEVDGQ